MENLKLLIFLDKISDVMRFSNLSLALNPSWRRVNYYIQVSASFTSTCESCKLDRRVGSSVTSLTALDILKSFLGNFNHLFN